MPARIDRATQVTHRIGINRRTGSRKRWFVNIVASLPNDHKKIAEVCQFQLGLKGNFVRIITRSFPGGTICLLEAHLLMPTNPCWNVRVTAPKVSYRL